MRCMRGYLAEAYNRFHLHVLDTLRAGRFVAFAP